MRRIYLDHNASGIPLPAAVARAVAVATEVWANPASAHQEGRRSRTVLEEARSALAALLGLPAGAVFFTSGGSEAAHAALRGCARARREREGLGRVVISSLEHACLSAAGEALARDGFDLVRVPPDGDGVVDAERFLSACGPETGVAALLVAHNEFGTLQPIGEVARALAERGVPLVADAVQAPGRVRPILPDGLQVLGVLSGHKMGGLHGAGAVMAREDLPLEPLISGGEQERGRRAGTPPLAAIAAMGEAARVLAAAEAGTASPQAAQRDRFENGLLAQVGGVTVIGRGRDRLPNTCAFVAEGVIGEDLVAALDLAGVAVSSGSACSTGSSRPSASLLAMGWTRPAARGLVRVSLGATTTSAEIDVALDCTVEAIGRLRRHAPAAEVRAPVQAVGA